MTWGVTAITTGHAGRPALEEVTLAVEPCSVAAVVGGDGAGKTTLLRLLAGLVVPDRGEVSIPDRRRIGYVPASGGVYSDLTVLENLEFLASAHRISDPDGAAAPLLRSAGLTAFTNRLAGRLSGGMRRKLAVIGAMLHRPDLLVLDEPTTGIDPSGRSELWRLIAASAAAGSAVVLSSAYLDEAERANTVLVLHEGRALVSGPPAAVRASMPGAVVETDRPGDASRSWRRGGRWREWLPEGSAQASPPDLEDVVIVASLARAGEQP